MTPDTMPNKSITVRVRNDGKFNACYHFPISGKHITKILTREQIESERVKGYEIFGL